MKRILAIIFCIGITAFNLHAQDSKGKTKSPVASIPMRPIPEVPPKKPIDSVPMGDSKSFPEMKLDIPVAPGPFDPTWESIEKTTRVNRHGFVKQNLVFGFILVPRPQERVETCTKTVCGVLVASYVYYHKLMKLRSAMSLPV